MFDVHFPRTRFDSKAGTRYIGTTGVNVGIGDPICLRPINTRGEVSPSCEIQVAQAAIPQLIAALLNAYQGIYGCYDNETHKWVGAEGTEAVEYDAPGKVYDFIHQTFGPDVYRACRYEPRLRNPAPGTPAEFIIRDTETSKYLADLDGSLKFQSEGSAAHYLVKTYGAEAARSRFEVEPARDRQAAS